MSAILIQGNIRFELQVGAYDAAALNGGEASFRVTLSATDSAGHRPNRAGHHGHNKSSMAPLLARFTAPIAVICLWAVAAAGSIDVATMVNDLQLQDSSAIAEILAKEGIDNHSLPLLTNEELEKLPGISRGARLRIVDYIQKHRQEAEPQQQHHFLL